MKADISTALVPVQAWIQPLRAVGRNNMLPFRQESRSQEGMRFLGFREVMKPCSYGSSGRAFRISGQGTIVDLYV